MTEAQNKGLLGDSGAEKRCYWLASRHSEMTEMPLAVVLTVEQNKGLLVDSGAEKRCGWRAAIRK